MENNVLFGKYKIISSLGQGGYSSVLLARHISLDCLRAIKVLRKDNILYDRLIKEACILKSLHHECIPAVYDIEEDEDCSYIIEEYCKGISLKKDRNLWGESDYSKIFSYSLQICDLIGYLHEGGHRILYLDLKPENLLVADGKVMLVDFGTAVFANEVDDMKVSMGTKGYAAPEQCQADARPDVRSDIYGIGCVIRFLAGKDFTDKRLGKVISKCMMESPKDRYESVEELAHDLIRLRDVIYKDNHCKRKNGIPTVGVMGKLWKNKAADNMKKLYGSDKMMICVAGTHRGAGATACVMMLVSFFTGYLKKRVIVVDVSDNEDICRMNMSDSLRLRGEGIRVVGKEYFNYENYEKAHAKMYEGYDVIIVDFGLLNAKKINMYITGNINIVATSINEWKLRNLATFVDRYSSFDKDNKWTYITCGGEKRIRSVEKLYDIHMLKAELGDEEWDNREKITQLLKMTGV